MKRISIVFLGILLASIRPPFRPGVTATALAHVPAVTSTTQKVFLGTLADRRALQFDLKMDGRNVTGSYFIIQPVPFSPQRLELKGKQEANGEITLDAVTYDNEGNEKRAKAFEGKVDGDLASVRRPARITGTWLGSGQGKPQSFTVSEQRAFPGTGLRFVPKRYTLQEKRLHGVIDAEYPQIEGSTDRRVIQLNREIKAFIFTLIKNFKRGCAETVKDDRRIATETGKPTERPGNTEDISFDVQFANRSLVSLAINEFSFFGGAHGVGFTYSLNYHLAEGKRLGLAALFQPRARYLQAISRHCIDVLHHDYASLYESRMFLDQLHTNASPSPENYKTWNLTPYGLLITFGEYQVAPYVMGQIQVVIPYSQMKGILRPNLSL